MSGSTSTNFLAADTEAVLTPAIVGAGDASRFPILTFQEIGKRKATIQTLRISCKTGLTLLTSLPRAESIQSLLGFNHSGIQLQRDLVCADGCLRLSFGFKASTEPKIRLWQGPNL